MFTQLTITRHSDNQTITVPVYMGTASADVGGVRERVPAPCLEADIDDAVSDFLPGSNIEAHMQYLYIDGDGLTSFDGDDYSYTLA